jgi:hypothetical protein
VLSNVEHYLGRAENVAGIPEGDGEAIRDREWAIVVNADKLPDSPVGVAGAVERFDRRQAMET